MEKEFMGNFKMGVWIEDFKDKDVKDLVLYYLVCYRVNIVFFFLICNKKIVVYRILCYLYFEWYLV